MCECCTNSSCCSYDKPKVGSKWYVSGSRSIITGLVKGYLSNGDIILEYSVPSYPLTAISMPLSVFLRGYKPLPETTTVWVALFEYLDGAVSQSTYRRPSDPGFPKDKGQFLKALKKIEIEIGHFDWPSEG